MNKALILTELQTMIDRLYLEGVRVRTVRLAVSGSGYETFDTTLKTPPPSQAAEDELRQRNEEKYGPNYPF